MTRMTLIHNPSAGDAEHEGDELREMFSSAGFEAVYQSTKGDEYKETLKEPGALVVVAGGDGTVRKVAKELVGSRVPLAVLPMGTANNIATSFGINGDARELVEGLKGARRVKFDVGVAEGPWGRKLFFEGFGLGLFTDVMTALDAKEERAPAIFENSDDPLAIALRALQQALREYRALDLRATLDGEDVSGRYLMVEAMNIRLVGPNLFLAPDADPGDGALDFVLLAEDQRREFDEYLSYRLEGKQEAPYLNVRRGRRLEFAWDGPTLHFDDSTWPRPKERDEMLTKAREDGEATAVEITLERGGLEFLVPASARRVSTTAGGLGRNE